MAKDPFVTEEEQAAIVAQAEVERRAEIYMGDLARVLALPEGRRVLRRWLDMANVFGEISAGGELTVKAAALSDYGKNRLYEIAAASPADYLKIMLAAAQNAAGVNNKE